MAPPSRTGSPLRSAWTVSLLGVAALALLALVVRAGQDDAPTRVASAPRTSPSVAAPAEVPSQAPVDAADLARQVSLVLDSELVDRDCADRAQAQDWTCLYHHVEPDSTQSVRLVLDVPAMPWSAQLDNAETARAAGQGAFRLVGSQLPHLDRMVVGEDGNDWVTVSRRTVLGTD